MRSDLLITYKQCMYNAVIAMFQGEIQALFLRHEGYLGAIGAFLKVVEEEGQACLMFWHFCLTMQTPQNLLTFMLRKHNITN